MAVDWISSFSNTYGNPALIYIPVFAACDPYTLCEDDDLCLFMAYIADSNLKHRTIELKLSHHQVWSDHGKFGALFVSSMLILDVQ